MFKKIENNKFHGILALFLAILFIFTVVTNIGDVTGANYYVAINGTDGNTGDSTDNAFKSVSRAINETNSNGGGDIIINSGTYKTSTGHNVTNLTISKDVNIYSAKYLNNSAGDTILDAEFNGRFFTIINGATVNIYGITFQNGKSSGNGGVIYSEDGNFNLIGCNFVNNNASNGSVIYIESGEGNITYSRFINNVGNYQIFNEGSGSVNADYNWWGNNNDPRSGDPNPQVSNNVDLTNWFVMVFNPRTGSTVKVGGLYAFDYSLMLNDSGILLHGYSHNLPQFYVSIHYQGSIVKYEDARYTFPVSITVSDPKNTIIARDLVFMITHTILTFDATPGETNLTVSNVVENYGKNITLTAKIVNIQGQGIEGLIVYFINNNGQFIGDGVLTNSEGIATLTFNPNASAGRYTYSARFQGLPEYYFGSNSSVATILINKIQTTHSTKDLTGTYGKTVTLRSTLRDVHGNLVASKLVEVWVNGKRVGRVNTTKSGIASFKHKINRTGKIKVEFRFNGDTNLIKSSAISTLTVKKHSKVSITNTVKKTRKATRLSSTIRNTGPDRLTAKVTYKLAKGLKAVKITKNLGKHSYNKKKRTITFNFSNFSKSNKLARLVITFNKAIKSKKYVTTKVTSSNTLGVSIKNK